MTPSGFPSRHDLVWPRRGWRAALRGPAPAALAEVEAWFERGLPAVAAARREEEDADAVALGVALPPAGARRRVRLVLAREAVLRASPPLRLREAMGSAPREWSASLGALDGAARGAGLVLRVYGSLSWQHLSGERHLTDRSDVDLLVRPRDAASLRRALDLLEARSDGHVPRLDGEVLLPGDRAISWRELAAARRRADGGRVLVKTSSSARLEGVGEALGALDAAGAIGAAAVDALVEELLTSPKPGLVGPGDPGAHEDMDAGTFAASVGSLAGYFPAVARAAIAGAPLSAMRALAVRAEARMLCATGGINTHRGAIFALGVLAAAAGRLAAARSRLDPSALGEAVRCGFGAAIRAELPAAPESHGAIAARRHGVGGARAEAADGFPHLFGVALPALDGALRSGASRKEAAVQSLFSTIAALADTNLLHRGGAAGLAFARAAAREFLDAGGVHRPRWREHACEIHRAFVARNLSPGGSADLLAAALFVDRLRALGRGA